MELGCGKEDEVMFTMDTEKATTLLLEMVVEVRVRMGLKAAKPYDKGRTVKVEVHSDGEKSSNDFDCFSGGCHWQDTSHGTCATRVGSSA